MNEHTPTMGAKFLKRLCRLFELEGPFRFSSQQNLNKLSYHVTLQSLIFPLLLATYFASTVQPKGSFQDHIFLHFPRSHPSIS